MLKNLEKSNGNLAEGRLLRSVFLFFSVGLVSSCVVVNHDHWRDNLLSDAENDPECVKHITWQKIASGVEHTLKVFKNDAQRDRHANHRVGRLKTILYLVV